MKHIDDEGIDIMVDCYDLGTLGYLEPLLRVAYEDPKEACEFLQRLHKVVKTRLEESPDL